MFFFNFICISFQLTKEIYINSFSDHEYDIERYSEIKIICPQLSSIVIINQEKWIALIYNSLNEFIGAMSNQDNGVINFHILSGYIILYTYDKIKNLYFSSITYSNLLQNCNNMYVSVGMYHQFISSLNSTYHGKFVNQTYQNYEKSCIWFVSPLETKTSINYSLEKEYDFLYLYISNNGPNLNYQQRFSSSNFIMYNFSKSFFIRSYTDSIILEEGYSIESSPLNLNENYTFLSFTLSIPLKGNISLIYGNNSRISYINSQIAIKSFQDYEININSFDFLILSIENPQTSIVIHNKENWEAILFLSNKKDRKSVV